VIHYLDDIRHFVAYAFQPYAWVPNISASMIQAAAVVLAVKVLRKRVEAWFHRGIRHFLSPHLEAHLEAVKQHVTAEIERIK